MLLNKSHSLCSGRASALASVFHRCQQRRHRTTNVLIFGDSNTWGFNPKPRLVPRRIPNGERWSDIMSRQLNEKSQEGDDVNVIVDALNARTTIFHDPASPMDGEYNCNGRDFLMTTLHRTKPLDVVVLALGVNDLKVQFSNTPWSIAAGVRILTKDIIRATSIGAVMKDEKGEQLTGDTPEIIILGVPIIKETPTSLSWGFQGASEKCEALNPLLREVAMGVDGIFVDLSKVADVSPLDGVHFDVDVQTVLGDAVANAVEKSMTKRSKRR
jgi:lysophospholipase L1-like esterase